MIMTDEWRSYSKIPDILGMHSQHLTVWYKQYFVDPITGACRNTVESMWSRLRRWLPQGGARKQFINDYLWCFVYRHNTVSTFERLLTTLHLFSQEKYARFLQELTEREEEIDSEGGALFPDVAEVEEEYWLAIGMVEINYISDVLVLDK
jgi:hypothetical protein